MALKRLTIDGYGQIEINNCTFRRDGRIEAQCKADATDFSGKVLENGMLLAIDRANRTVKLPVDGSLPIALNYSAEHMYDERKPGLKNFYLKPNDDFLPRLGYPTMGDKFTTNCVAYDSTSDTAWTNDTAFLSAMADCKTSVFYGGACANGAIAVSATKPTYGPVLRVVEKTTMPDGTDGLMFECFTA